MKLKTITCIQCGRILCRAKVGSEIEMFCHHCRTEIKGIVDPDGGVHVLPLETKDNSKDKRLRP